MKLGIDAGSFSIKVVALDEKNDILWKKEYVHANKIKETLEIIYDDLKAYGEDFSLGFCGARAHLLGLDGRESLTEMDASIYGLQAVYPECKSLISLGAQRTYYVRFGGAEPVISRNTNCSAGTGSFFEEQAGRLQIPLGEISDETTKAETIPQIAGRCSVFSKTDMIHLMQEGLPTADILLGLCYAMVRNFRGSILHNREVKKPVYLSGGVMKNAGVIRALQEEMNLSEGDYVLDDNSDFLAAIGAALASAEDARNQISLGEMKQALARGSKVEDRSEFPALAPFREEGDSPEFTTYPYQKGEKSYLGIDIGSTSINLVLLNEEKKVLYYSYVKTIGKPLTIVRAELEKLREALGVTEFAGLAVTGSGREYIGRQIGASLVINEITAQTEGALLSYPETDTIFEIGGQDSKYMSIKDGKMADFEMNKVCAAGTGAFLEEQIKKLGISMEEFLTLSMKSEHPCLLGDRCTVFIEGSINRALAEGHSMEDVCAGLAYAIVSNYLNRVVNRKPIGDHIGLQGGIAYNQAVICAFRALTGKSVHVTPYFAVTGAMGAASLAMQHAGLSFDKERNQKLNALLNEKSEESYLRDYRAPKCGSGKKVIGIPRVIFLHKMFPLFNAMFHQLGFEVLISPLTDKTIVGYASNHATADACYPIRLIYGHVEWLLEQGVDYILLPRLYTIKHEGSVARKDYACMYMQTAPLLMEQAFHLKERGVTLLSPQLSLQFGKKYMINSLLTMAKPLGVPKPLMVPAAIRGFATLVAHAERLEAIGQEALEGEEPIFVIVSRVYNIIDPVLNMGIEDYLNRVGCRVVHLEHLQASYMHVEHDYRDMYWPFGQHILTGLKLIKANKNFYPIYITNHGCGPDTAIQHFFQNEMQGRDYLHLEVDEHSSPVGIITRLEAFLYSIKPQEAVGEATYRGRHWGHDCTAHLDYAASCEMAKADYTLLPELGIYTDVLEKYLPEDHAPVIRVAPLTKHHSFTYAMNKEYYSLLVMMEEVKNTVCPGKSYDFYCPIDEGSEVFGQYALLISQELNKTGYDIRLHSFYLEDLIGREDYRELYQDLIAAETGEPGAVGACKSSGAVDAKLAETFLIGEPLALYKDSIGGKLTGSRMPYSEALLFHMRLVDRDGKYTARLREWKKLHDEVDSKAYSDIDRLETLAEGKLDFMIGDAAKYRFAKLLSLEKSDWKRVLLVHSAEENSAIILKNLIEGYEDQISVPYECLDLDFEHRLE